MKKTQIFTKVVSIIICTAMFLGMLPIADVYAAIEDAPGEWIAGFESVDSAKHYAESNQAEWLGGPFVLVKAQKSDLAKTAGIISLTENAVMKGTSVSSITDPYASEQYVLTHKTLYAQSAWSKLETYLTNLETPLTPADCATVRVAVIDSGIDATHEDLAGRVVDGWDAVNKTAISRNENSDVSTDFHGTKVAGLIGAVSDNALGIAGMAWTFPVELIPVRVLDSNNNASIADVVAAIYWAVDEGEADILNLSFGKEMKYVPAALQTAAYHAIDNGVLVVAAAGNDGKYYKTETYSYYPAALEGVMPVGSLSKTLYNGSYPQKADFSNRTYNSSDCGKSFFYVPGEELLTTSGNNTYESFTGTSASAATFTGMLAALKSCADATGAPGVENYLSYTKYSNLGALDSFYYQDYSYMATALVNGYTSNDVRFTFNEYAPNLLKGKVKLEGVINDPNMLYKEIRFYVNDVFVDSAERTATVKQRMEFTWDTTQFADETYYPYQMAICGVDKDGNETEIEIDFQCFTICNESDFYTVKILSNGSPLVGSPYYLSNREGDVDTTNSLGEIYIYPDELGDDARIMVISDDVIISRKLEKYPTANSYTFGNNPAMLTISVSEEQLESFYGATIYVDGFDNILEAGKITCKETKIAVDADEMVTITIVSDKAILKKSLDLSEDFVWRLDEDAAGSINLTHDNKAPSDTEDGYVTMLGLEIEGLEKIMLPPEGGSMLISPGEYNVSGYVYWYYSSDYYDYAKVDLGKVIIENGKAADLVIGSGKLTEEVSIAPENLVEGDKLTITYNLTDSNGNTVITEGSHYVPDNESWPAEYLNCYIDSYEDGEWVELTSFYTNPQYTKDAFARFNAGTAATVTSGKRRIRFDESDYTFEFEVKPQEERASAKIYITLASIDGWTVYNVKAATTLKDADGNNVVRESYNDQYGEMAILNLPIGEKYTVAVMGVDYSIGYMTKCDIDLTETAEDEEVTVKITPDESWIAHTLVQNYPDNGSDMVNAFGFAPFDGFDQIIEAAGDYNHIETIYSSQIEKEDMLFSVVMDRYDFETYDCFPLFKIEKSVDWSQSNELSFGAAESLSVTIKVEGNSAKLTPVLTDAFGNSITDAEYFVPKGMEVEMPGGASIEVTMVYPLIEVYDSEGNKVFYGNTTFEGVSVEGLSKGQCLAAISWNSTNLHLEGESVEFAIGDAEAEGGIVTAPVAFRAKAADNSINLTWKKPVSGAAGYELHRDGESIAVLEGEALTYTDKDVREGGYYMYTLYAIGENGARSNGVTVGVQLGENEDNNPPVWGENAKIEATVADGGVSLKWSKATDDGTGVTSYTLYCNGEEIAQKFTRNHVCNGFMPGDNYTFTVTATDGSGNVSEELTSEAISLESGILGHNLAFAKNRLGYMTGTAFTAVANTTGDIEGLTGKIEYTLAGGESKTENVEFNGANGCFTWQKTFESTLISINSLTVDCEGGYECIESPILRKSAKVKVKVELSALAEIYSEGTLTLYSKALDYAYTYPITNMEGTIENHIIAAADYCVTLTGGNGQVLVNQKHSITEDTEITLDENSIRLLKVVLEAPQNGFTLTLESDNGAVAGVSCEDGTIIWQNGSEWISVGENVTLKNEKFFYSEKLSLENGINLKTIDEKVTDTYEPVTAHIRVKDTNGNYLSNVRVEFATSVDNKSAVTDEDGNCEAELVRNKWSGYVYINIPEQKQGKRVIHNTRATIDVKSTFEVIVELGYEDVEITPVLDMEADMDKVTFTLDGEKIKLNEGKLYQRRTSGYFTKQEDMELWAEYTADGIGYKGIASFTRSETQPQEVKINMKPLVDVKLSLTDNGDALKGTKRHFKICDSKNRVVDSFSTYDLISTVKLMEGERYTVYAGWGSGSDYKNFIVREGMEVALSLKYKGFMSEVLGGNLFFVENGFTGNRSISLNQNGDIYVNTNFTSWNIVNPDVSEAYNYIVLPEGAENIKFSCQYEYDSASCTIKKTANIANWEDYINIDALSFTIPYEKLTEDAALSSYVKFVYDGEEYTWDNNGFSLIDYAVALYVPERASEAQDGVKISVSLPLAKKGTLEIYDGASLVASSATEEGKVKYDFNIKLSNSLGSHNIKAVYTTDEVSLTRQKALLVVDDGRPIVKTAEVSFDYGNPEDILNPTKVLTYQVSGKNIAYCTATFTNPDKVEKAWLVGKTDSEFDRIELLRVPGTDRFTGIGRLGDLTNYVTALRIEFEEAPLSVEETGETVQGVLEWDYELIVPVGDTDTKENEEYEGFDFGTFPGDSEEEQMNAQEDWSTYVSMVNNGIFDKAPEEAEAEFKEFFGEDNTWDLPSVTNGEDFFKESFEYNPDEVEEKLNSPEAFTVEINGEARKVLIEVEVVGDELYVTYYGIGDLLLPSVPLFDTDTVSGAGLGSQLKGWAKDAWKVYNQWKSYGVPIKDLLYEDDDDTDGADGGSPCEGSGEGAREKRRKEVDKAFDEGWELSKKTAGLLGWLQLGGFSGSISPGILTDDDGPAHALFELQKNRIHQIDDILDQMDPESGSPSGGDPCNPDEPNGPNGPDGTNKDKKQNDTQDPGTPINPLVDPSGYLYRGGEGHGAEGVNASIYYLEEDGENWTLWNSEDYGEGPNPYISEANGYYGWDVLMGKWKVVFEGEGYNRAESVELLVPPPHLDVDIMLTSTLAPKAESVIIKADGSIYIKFDHLMTLDSLNSDTVTVRLGDEVLTGTITPIDETVTKLGVKQKALDTDAKVGVSVASIFKFTPTDAPLSGMTVSLDLDKSILGYNGISMKENGAYSLTVPEVDCSMTLYSLENVLEDNLYLTIGESYDLSSAWKATYTDGFGTFAENADAPIVWSTNKDSVATVSAEGIITAKGDGIATIFGECEGKRIAFGVYVERAPIKANNDENTVKFCRESNLVVDKACYVWSEASNFSLEGEIDGDEKYMTTAWRIKEGGAITAEGVVSDEKSSILEIYTPQTVGVLVAEIDYELYEYKRGRWTATGQIDTAVREIEVTEVTGISVNTPPVAFIHGEELDLSNMLIDIALSDNTVSTVEYKKLASYGITMSMNQGDTVTIDDTVLTLTHERTGQTLDVPLTVTHTHDFAEDWITDGIAHWHECSICNEQRDYSLHSEGLICTVCNYDKTTAVAKAEITAVEDGKVKITSDINVNLTLILADYENGAIHSLKRIQVVLTKGKNEITIPEGITLGSGDKLMLWKINFTSLRNVGNVYVIE